MGLFRLAADKVAYIFRWSFPPPMWRASSRPCFHRLSRGPGMTNARCGCWIVNGHSPWSTMKTCRSRETSCRGPRASPGSIQAGSAKARRWESGAVESGAPIESTDLLELLDEPPLRRRERDKSRDKPDLPVLRQFRTLQSRNVMACDRECNCQRKEWRQGSLHDLSSAPGAVVCGLTNQHSHKWRPAKECRLFQSRTGLKSWVYPSASASVWLGQARVLPLVFPAEPHLASPG